jgi:hypothetical protein
MRLYGAIDLHSNNNVTVVTDEQDHVVYEKRLPNDLALITQAGQLPRFTRRYRHRVNLQLVLAHQRTDGPGHKIHLANTPPFNSTKD